MASFSSFQQLRHDEHAAAARSRQAVAAAAAAIPTAYTGEPRSTQMASFSSSLPQLNPASLKARNEALWPTCSCSCGSAASAAAAAAHPQAIALGLWPPERKPIERPHPHSIRPALMNPDVSVGLDEHFSDWRPQEVAASALHDLCGSMHQQLQNQRHTADEAASRHRTYLSLMAQKHKRLSAEASHAREGEAKCAELERALKASLQREDEAQLREAELARRLAQEVHRAAQVEPLLRRLEEAKAALSGAQLAAMASGAEHVQLARIAELERRGDVQVAEKAAADWRSRAERASALLPRCRAHILASRAAVELGFSGLATARSIDELGSLSSALFEVKAHMLALEEDLALAAIKPSKAQGRSPAATRSADPMDDSMGSSAGGRTLRVSKKEAARW